MIKTGNKNFWKAQLIGWFTMAFSNLIVQLIAGFPTKVLIYNSLIPLVLGFSVTTAYRYLIKDLNWKHWSFGKMLGLIIVSTFLLGLIVAFLALFLFEFISVKEEITLAKFLSNFIIFSILMLAWNSIYFCVHYFNNWNRAEIEKWKLAAEIKDAQLGSLKAQINPHFVFNALNNIRALILEDKDKAREMLQNFSDLFRYALKNTDQSKVPLEQEVEIVNQYLELLSIQYEEKLRYEVVVDSGLEAVKIPPMMLQLLVENAVKHGISQFKEGGEVLVEVAQTQGELIINVKNTGSLGVSASLGDKLGVGLENIRKRLDLIYNGKANLEMKELNNQVIASIQIPMI